MANSNAWAVFIIDPGEQTGVCKALVDLRQKTVRACLRRAYLKGNLVTSEVRGTYEEQAWIIAPMVLDFFYNATFERAAVPQGNWSFIIERFNPNRQQHANHIPLEIIAGVQTLLRTPGGSNWLNGEYDNVRRFQDPSQAMGFVSDDMLRRWGWGWKGRSSHERDTIRHLGYVVDAMLEGRY